MWLFYIIDSLFSIALTCLNFFLPAGVINDDSLPIMPFFIFTSYSFCCLFSSLSLSRNASEVGLSHSLYRIFSNRLKKAIYKRSRSDKFSRWYHLSGIRVISVGSSGLCSQSSSPSRGLVKANLAALLRVALFNMKWSPNPCIRLRLIKRTMSKSC
jgi:hypothetical protein